MKLELVMADPAGNRTALVRTPVEPGERAETAKKIMALPRLRAEQVGFCCPPKTGKSLGHLEMMGGEFCGNAARSFALLLAAERGSGPRTVPIEVSGCGEVLLARADPSENTAACPMPLPTALEELPVPGLAPEGPLPAVIFQGILHVIAQGIPPTQENFAAIREAVSRRWDWEAMGVMFLGAEGFLSPAVEVRATGSLVFESSCASGSTALAVWLSRGLSEGERTYPIPQPGGTLSIRVEKRGGKLTGLTAGGPVTLEPAVTVEV